MGDEERIETFGASQRSDSDRVAGPTGHGSVVHAGARATGSRGARALRGTGTGEAERWCQSQTQTAGRRRVSRVSLGAVVQRIEPRAGRPWPGDHGVSLRRGTVAPRSVTAVSDFDRCHVSLLPRHHAWRGTGIWPRQGNRRGQKC